ncbi:uncharacterized protein V6R79_004941 [Siganus canaliculatus]
MHVTRLQYLMKTNQLSNYTSYILLQDNDPFLSTFRFSSRTERSSLVTHLSDVCNQLLYVKCTRQNLCNTVSHQQKEQKKRKQPECLLVTSVVHGDREVVSVQAARWTADLSPARLDMMNGDKICSRLSSNFSLLLFHHHFRSFVLKKDLLESSSSSQYFTGVCLLCALLQIYSTLARKGNRYGELSTESKRIQQNKISKALAKMHKLLNLLNLIAIHHRTVFHYVFALVLKVGVHFHFRILQDFTGISLCYNDQISLAECTLHSLISQIRISFTGHKHKDFPPV